ncbi:COPII subunit [Pichia kluyveri]|uniref:COPII subunit n=1 Tax=Pichia kluyveri TaxID=36015 RepID=A0AAV5RBC7_PICKL|nr:COPII subunit [Pichia kluyveri]
MASKRRAYPQPAYDPLANGNINNNILPPTSNAIPQQQQSISFQQQQQQQIPFQQVPIQQTPLNSNPIPNINAPYNASPYDLSNNFQNLNINNVNNPNNLNNINGPAPEMFNELYSTDLLKDIPPPIIDLQFPPPPINLPINSSITQSPESNTSSDYIRSTLNVVPNSNNLLKKSKLPFALTIRPYLSLTDNENPLPIINDGIISRCRRCRAYINPFVELRNDNSKWKCNFCSLLNELPSMAKNDQFFNRYELNYGAVEFLATPEYMVRAPQSLNYLFLIDVSINSIKNGLLSTSIRTILDSLDRIPNDHGRANVSFIAVDKNLSFFEIPNDNDENNLISMLVVSVNDDDPNNNSLDDLIIPCADNLVVNLKNSRKNIEKLLNNFTSYFINNQSIDFNLSTALKTGHKLLQNIGGKMIVISSSLPNIGKGKLIIRDEKAVSGKNKENSLLISNNSFYKSFAIDCNKSQITVDMFLTSSTYQDVATLSNLTKFTAGQTHFYPAFNSNNLEDINKFSNELSNHLSMEIGLEAVLRVRCSDGIKGNAYFGNFFSRSSDLLSFPSFPRDQSYVVELSIDNDIRRNIVYFQTAILHTSCHSDRRIRVLTLALPVSNNLNNIYASADQLSILNYFTHVGIEKILNNSFEIAREYLNKSILEILNVYKKEIVATNVGSSSPLQISTNLRMLPLLIQSLIKNISFRSGMVPSDHRSNSINKLNSLPINELIQFIYPSIYSLHDMNDECGLPYEGEDNFDEIIPKLNGEIILPECINASINYLQRFGLYLINTNNEIFIYIGGDAIEQLIFDVFGVNSINEILIGKRELPILDNEFNQRIHNIINKIREKSGSIKYSNVYIVIGPSNNEANIMNSNIDRNRDLIALRMWCMSTLVEDRSNTVQGYREYLSQLKDKLSN